MEYDYAPILDRIKKAKKDSGLRTEDIASASGIPLGTLNKIFAGQTTEPKIGTMIALANTLHISVDYLLYGSEKPNNQNDSTLTPHEKTVITAYRDQPAMQPAVDKLLGVESISATPDDEDLQTIRIAARGGMREVTLSKKDREKIIQDAEAADDDISHL